MSDNLRSVSSRKTLLIPLLDDFPVQTRGNSSNKEEIEIESGIAARLGPMLDSIRVHYFSVTNADNDDEFTAEVATRWSFDGKTGWSPPNALSFSPTPVGSTQAISSADTDKGHFGLHMKYFLTVWNATSNTPRTARVSLVLEATLKT